MKIALNMKEEAPTSNRAVQAKAIENHVVAAKKGDWNAKHNLERAFMPLMTSLAEKRTTDTAEFNTLIEGAKDGLARATKKYKLGGNFQIFALDFIEKSMDGGGGGLFSRLFGRS
jgi:hypothetical protein